MEQSSRVDLNLLHTFYWVAKSASFTKSSRILALPKSTVSRHIRLLEEQLGTRLLERTTRSLALTEIGHVFLAHCQRVISEAEEAQRSVTAFSDEPKGLLRVAVPTTFAHTFLGPILPGFCRKHPKVKLELILRGDHIDPVQTLCDVVIQLGCKAEATNAVRKIGSIERALFASRAYLKQHPAPTSPAELATHTTISTNRTPRGAHWRLINASGQPEEVSLDPLLAVPDPTLAYRFAVEGFGIAILPHFLARKDRRLVRVLPDWRPPSADFFAVYPGHLFMLPKLRVFLDELESNLHL